MSNNSLSSQQRLLMAFKDARSKIQALERAKTEPIAIIGMGCRLPGGADNPEAFWQLLCDGVDTISEVPKERWNIDQFYDPDPDAKGKMYTRYGGFLKEAVDQFDPQFFGISPREARSIDPQQRLLLEVAWEALEHAGQTTERLRGSQTGVFIGISTHDYEKQIFSDANHIDAYTGLGSAPSMSAGRLAYLLGVHGPTLQLDTACSSSLLAIHLAVMSLRASECDMALAGGVNLMLSPLPTIFFCKTRALSPDGRCKTFDASADGYSRGEGCGVVVLKRLSDALRDKDNILALIRGSAVNHDGPSSGLTVPNRRAQESLIRQALKNGKIEPHLISYVEAHGTGTSLGDPIELGALADVFRREHSQPLIVGSAKTNIGHLEAAAGVAGLIKCVLALQHGQIPPHLHFKEPNPLIDWDKPLFVPTELMHWPKESRLAGVSSFGFSGTNVHVILEAAKADDQAQLMGPTQASPNPESAKELTDERPLHLLTLSAKTEGALHELVARYEKYLVAKSGELADICYTANTGRRHFNHRLAVVAANKLEVMGQLADFKVDTEASPLFQASFRQPPQVAFLFTGQGSQYVGMGLDLYETQPTFRQVIDECHDLLARNQRYQIPLRTLLFSDTGLLDETAYTQVALFALEYALAKLWESWGVVPDVVMGHSVGELVAACVAGVFSLEDGLKLVVERGRLMQATARGDMVAVFASETQVSVVIDRNALDVSIAAMNGPESVVISGSPDGVGDVVAELEALGIKTKRLAVSHAFHSPLMEPILADFLAVARQARFSPPKIAFISNMTGQLVTSEMSRPEYWVRHLRQPVRFYQGISSLVEQGVSLFVEIGPKPVLLGMGRRGVPSDYGVWLPTLRPSGQGLRASGEYTWSTLLASVAQLYVRGVEIDWVGFERDYAKVRRKVVLPTYPWQRESYIIENKRRARTHSKGMRSMASFEHPLLQEQLYSATLKKGEVQFEAQLSAIDIPYLADHRFFGQAILPASAYLEMALAAGSLLFEDSSLTLEDVVIEQVLRLDEPKTVQLILRPSADVLTLDENGTFDGTDYSWQIFSLAVTNEKPRLHAHAWTRHAAGKIRVAKEEPAQAVELSTLQARLQEDEQIKGFYQQFTEQEIVYRESFQGVRRLWRSEGEALGQVQLAEHLFDKSYQLHPALLDASFQVLAAALPALQEIYMPVACQRFTLWKRPERDILSHVQLRSGPSPLAPRPSGEGKPAQETINADLRLVDTDGQVYAEMFGFQLKKARRESVAVRELPRQRDWLYKVAWPEAKSTGEQVAVNEANDTLASEAPEGDWLILADRTGIAQNLADQLNAHGMRTQLVYPNQTGSNDLSRSAPPNTTEVVTTIECNDFSRSGPPNTTEAWLGRSERVVTTIQWQELLAGRSYRGVVYLWSLDSQRGGRENESFVSNCGQVLHLVQALIKNQMSQGDLKEPPRLWLVTKGAQSVARDDREEVNPIALWQAPLWGLGKVIALEHPELRTVCLDLPPDTHSTEHVKSLLHELLAPDAENLIAYRRDVRHVARLEPYRQIQVPSHPIAVKLTNYGTLDNLSLVPISNQVLGPEEVEIEVRASGLNFRDVLRALGMMREVEEALGIKSAADVSFGFECAGVIKRVGENVEEFKVGDPVIAAMTSGSLASLVTAQAKFVTLKPAKMSFEEAATIPVTFLTAYYGLVRCANIGPTDRVLIHAAAGGVGQAAVQLALHAGAEVFATASPPKWEFLKSLGIKHIYNSRTLEFAEQVMALTNGEGVDVVLNSLNGEFIDKSFEILGKGGRFVEIGKLGIWDEQKVQTLRPDVHYFPFDLGEIEPSLISSMLEELMAMFREGSLKALPLKVFPITHVVDAFRYMQQAKHIGKVVLRFQQRKKEIIRQDGSYLVTGGLGALGLKVAHWLIKKGAQHLVLTGRSGANQAAKNVIKQLEEAGANISLIRADVANREEVKKLLAACPNLRGIVHAAGVLDDGILMDQTLARFEKVMSPKIKGAWNLHTLTENLPLDFFVLFSSAASLIGSAGQANYAAANAFMDALADYRQAVGKPALSINWGAWAKSGMAASLEKRLNAQGIKMIAPEQGLQVLGELLEDPSFQVGVLPMEWAQYQRQYSSGAEPPLLSFVFAEAQSRQAKSITFLKKFNDASATERPKLLVGYIQKQVAQVLGLARSQLDIQQPLNYIGFDSLMAVELRNRMKSELAVELSVATFLEGLSVSSLATHVMQQMLKLRNSTRQQDLSPTRKKKRVKVVL